MLRILTCLKWVALRPEIDPLTGAVAVDPRFSGAGPADLSALEWSLRLAGQVGGRVDVVTVGGPEAEPMLRDALAVGVDRAVRIDGPTASDSRSVAVALARHCELDDDVELVVCGDLSLDRGSGSVPSFIAHELGWPQALGLVGAATADSGWVLERRLDQGRRERLALVGPGVVSFERGPDLRRASLSGTLAAGTSSIDIRPMPVVAPDGHRPTVIGSGPYRPRAKVKPAPTGDTRQRLLALVGAGGQASSAEVHEVGPEVGAAILLDRLTEWGYLDPAPTPSRSGEPSSGNRPDGDAGPDPERNAPADRP